MFKIFLIFFFAFNICFAKDLSFEVFAKLTDITVEKSAIELLTNNGLQQAVTNELNDLSFNSETYWNKIAEKKWTSKEENDYLQSMFENISVTENAEKSEPEINPLLNKVKKQNDKISGVFRASINLEKLKASYIEIANDLEKTKLKTFYIIPEIEIDSKLAWEDVGVEKKESFVNAIIDSWKLQVEKDIKGFDKVVILEKDIANKPEYLNSKSVTLKWTSVLKKTSNESGNHLAQFELSAHFVVQNTKLGSILLAFDFPIQKREVDIQNKKTLSSSLASLVFNSLYSQSVKINEITTANSTSVDFSEVEISMSSKTSLSEINQINVLLKEKFKDIKLTSRLKSYSSDHSELIIKAEGSIEKILDSLSSNEGKIILNEQKILLFNRVDKTFAILLKGPNN